jgi:HEAT repeat protein
MRIINSAVVCITALVFMHGAAIASEEDTDRFIDECVLALKREPENNKGVCTSLEKTGLKIIPKIKVLLSDDDERIRNAAVGIFVNMGMPAVESLINELKYSDNETACDSSISALVRIGAPAVKPLTSLFATPQTDTPIDVTNQRRRRGIAAIKGLGKIAFSALHQLLLGDKEQDQINAARAVYALDKSDPLSGIIVSDFITMSKSPSLGIRDAAVRGLGEFIKSSVSAKNCIISALEDEDPLIFIAAKNALVEKLGVDETIRILKMVFEKDTKEKPIPAESRIRIYRSIIRFEADEKK